jgi:hypothetical protein
MKASTRPRIALAALLLVLLLGAGYAGLHAALERLRTAVAQALGPRASIGALHVGWAGLEASEVRVRAAEGSAAQGGWPAADERRARRIRIVPALDSLWRGGWRIERITVEGGYVSALRTRDGRLRLLPSLLEGADPTLAVPPLAIGEVRLVDAALDFFDATVRAPAHRLQIMQLQATIGPIALPALDAPIGVDLRGLLKGVRHDGGLEIAGELTPATRDARLDARFTGVDLLVLQPYLVQAADAGVQRGRLDLSVHAEVAGKRLHAPGTLTLDGLELAPGKGVLASFAGVPRQAVLAALQRDGRIRLRFTLDGRLDDPAFSLNENIATRITSGLADSLGVSIEGVVQAVGKVVKGLLGR